MFKSERIACVKPCARRKHQGERDSSIHSLPDVPWLGKGRLPGFAGGEK